MASDDFVELRGRTPRWVVDVLDGYAIAHSSGITKTDRMDVVNEVLMEWAKRQMHLVKVLDRLTRGNPPDRSAAE